MAGSGTRTLKALQVWVDTTPSAQLQGCSVFSSGARTDLADTKPDVDGLEHCHSSATRLHAPLPHAWFWPPLACMLRAVSTGVHSSRLTGCEAVNADRCSTTMGLYCAQSVAGPMQSFDGLQPELRVTLMGNTASRSAAVLAHTLWHDAMGVLGCQSNVACAACPLKEDMEWRQLLSDVTGPVSQDFLPPMHRQVSHGVVHKLYCYFLLVHPRATS